MASPATRRKTGPKPGVRQHREPELRRQARIDQALDSVGEDGRFHPIPDREWHKLRAEVWAKWSELPDAREWPADERRVQSLRRSIAKPLKHYGQILRQLRDHPEYGLTTG